VKFLLEGLVGLSDRVRAYGIGMYPIDVAYPLRGGAVTPYLVAGGTLRWLDRSDTDGEVGGLATIRAAVGARVGRHLVVELGVGCSCSAVPTTAPSCSRCRATTRAGARPAHPDRMVAGASSPG